MKTLQIPMTVDEFHLMPWKFGWKHEYANGFALLTPRDHCVSTIIKVEPRIIPSHSYNLRAVLPGDSQRLKDLYFQAFHDSVEFCNQQEISIQKSASDCMDKFFQTMGEDISSLSQVAVSTSGRLLGTALVIPDKCGLPFLRLLCVAQSAQRQGIGTNLVATLLNKLLHINKPQLKSGYFMANEISRNWHHKFGFQDEPDLFTLKILLSHAHHDLWRQEKIGALPIADMTKLTSNVRKLEKQVEIEQEKWEQAWLKKRRHD